ncbi:26905_t:CDS:2, partial [Racocetra persica]
CAKDPNWYVQPLIDLETNRLQDIILNDNTTSTNTYNLPLSIFAIAILPEETSESYRWVLQQTIEATGVQPGAFIIDADPGLESVVPEIYLNTYLLHCVWHIERNLERQLLNHLVIVMVIFSKHFAVPKMFCAKKHLE